MSPGGVWRAEESRHTQSGLPHPNDGAEPFLFLLTDAELELRQVRIFVLFMSQSGLILMSLPEGFYEGKRKFMTNT